MEQQPQGLQQESIAQKVEYFKHIQASEYKNPAMFAAEPEYLKSDSFTEENLSADQKRRQASELALRLGRAVKKQPDRVSADEAGKIFAQLVPNAAEAATKTVIFYENDEHTPRELITFTETPFDFEPFLQDPVKNIEQAGINLQQHTEDHLIEKGQFIREDKSRVRQIMLKNLETGEFVPAIAKRIRLSRVRTEPFEELQIMKHIQENNLPGVQPIAGIQSHGNYYILMEKVPGMTLKSLLKNPEKHFAALMNQDPITLSKESVQNQVAQIQETVAQIDADYQKIGIFRKDFQAETQDLMINYDENAGKFRVTPIDFEKVVRKK